MVFIVCFAWLIFDCIEGIGLAGGFLGAALFMGGIGADFVPKFWKILQNMSEKMISFTE